MNEKPRGFEKDSLAAELRTGPMSLNQADTDDRVSPAGQQKLAAGEGQTQPKPSQSTVVPPLLRNKQCFL